MVNFAWGLFLGYFMGIYVQYYITKLDKKIKDEQNSK